MAQRETAELGATTMDDEGAYVDGQSGLRPRGRLLGLNHFANRIIPGFG